MNFTVIKMSGRTEFFPDGNYFSILSNISHEYGTAGVNWDRPNMLLLDGKVVVGEGLADIAWDYGKRNRELHEALKDALTGEFMTEWLRAALTGGNDAT
mgnify:FL=1